MAVSLIGLTRHRYAAAPQREQLNVFVRCRRHAGRRASAGRIAGRHRDEAISFHEFWQVLEKCKTSLADLWYRSEAFNRFRGTDWMAEPCRSCERREIDWGGCRCQAFLVAGEAALQDAEKAPDAFVYRHFN